MPRGRRPNSKYPLVQACKSLGNLSLGLLPFFPITQPMGFLVQQVVHNECPLTTSAECPAKDDLISRNEMEDDLSEAGISPYIKSSKDANFSQNINFSKTYFGRKEDINIYNFNDRRDILVNVVSTDDSETANDRSSSKDNVLNLCTVGDSNNDNNNNKSNDDDCNAFTHDADAITGPDISREVETIAVDVSEPKPVPL